MQPLKPDAGQRFADVGLKSIAEDPPSEHRDLMIHTSDAAAWMPIDHEVQELMGQAGGRRAGAAGSGECIGGRSWTGH